MKYTFTKRIAFILFLFLFMPLVMISQTPGEVLDSLKGAETWQDLFGLYEIVMIGLTLILTELSKFVPFFNKIKGPWKAVVVVAILVIAGALKFGITSIASPAIIWVFASMIYDKLIKSKDKEATSTK